MASDVKWIKITTDIFDDEKILLIESLPDAYAIITVWFKLLCLAGKQNNSGVFMIGRIPYTDKMLATIFRMKEATVAMALQTFEQFGMIELIDGVITIPNWDKHQSLDKCELAKEQTRLRVAKHREKQKLLANGNVTRNVTVTECNADRIDKEVKQELKQEKDLFTTTTTTGEAPSLTEVYVYFRGCSVDDASKEADKFHAYNANKGWTCLPDWKATADLWIARIGEKR